MDEVFGQLLADVAALVEGAAGEVVGGAFGIRTLIDGDVAWVGSDDPASMVAEYGTETLDPRPWAHGSLDLAARRFGGESGDQSDL